MRALSVRAVALLAAVLITSGVSAEGPAIEFDFEASTPVGSWQEREVVTTDKKGKQTLAVTRVSYLGDEDRGGETYAWVETHITNYKVKKKGRKPQGDPMYLKVLMKKDLLRGDVINSIGNFNELATEIIMQTGDAQPMRMKGAGSMMGGMAQAMGLKVDYSFEQNGSDSISVPAGEFSCDRYKGQGSASAKVVFKTINVQSTSEHWISSDVPFGLVKVVADDVVNGDPQHSETVLTAFGRSGASSKITGEPMEMPSMGDIFSGGQ